MRRLLPLLALAAADPTFGAHYDAKSAVSKEPRICSVHDLRYPVWSRGHYQACFSQRFRTVEKWGGYFYGGTVGHADRGETLIQICSWQMGGKDAPAAGIDFIHAGPHMSWAKTTWEGSAGGIKGMWPADELRNNVWYRFVSRAWSGPGGSPDHSFIGVWMKDTGTGEWYHLATTRYPGVIRDIDDHHGFQENFAGERADPVATVDVRNMYSLRGGAWVSDDRVQLRAQSRELVSITSPEPGALRLRTYWSHTKRTSPEAAADRTFDPKKVDAVLKQPATPDYFDPVGSAGLSAFQLGGKLAVKWEVPSKNSPQLSALLEIFDDAGFRGAPVRTVRIDNPDTRDALVDIGDMKDAHVRLTVTDIFDRRAAPATCPATAASPLAPEGFSHTAGAVAQGLEYGYYEAPEGVAWRKLPDFSTLTPVSTGTIATPDVSPRKRRENYAFRFAGDIIVPPTPILRRYTLISSAGSRLLIDGKTVIDHDGPHSIGPASGSVALAPGSHRFELVYFQGARQSQQADDFLRLVQDDGAGPVPSDGFVRKFQNGRNTPTVETKPGVTSAEFSLRYAGEPDRNPVSVRYYMPNPGFDYFGGQGVYGAPYFLGETGDPAGRITVPIWGPGKKEVFARLVYADGTTSDTAAASFDTRRPDLGPWTLTELEHHQYPVAAEVKGGLITLVGESMSLLTKPLTGDGEIIARLADITPHVPAPDGTRIDAGVWQAGIILRNGRRPSPGEPLGGNTDYAALLGKANGDICFIDSTMKNGAGNQPSRNQGGRNRWLKITRRGATFTSAVSPDGKTWKEVKTVDLPKAPATLDAGFFLYALPSSNLTLHRAAFDNVSVTPEK